jgi:hypothetical protein
MDHRHNADVSARLERVDLDQYSGRPAALLTTVSAGLWPANRPRSGCVDGRPVLVPVTGDGDRDLRDLPWAGPAAARGRDYRTPTRPGGQARSHSWLARPPASLADFLADGPAPSWLVRVGTCLALHFPGNHRLCLDRPGLLVRELGRRLFAILPGPAAKETHSAAKETHSGSIGRWLADFSHPEGRSAGMSKCFVRTRGDRTSGPAASTAMTGRPNGPQGPQGPKGDTGDTRVRRAPVR